MIWNKLPKGVFLGATVLKFGDYEAVSHFNIGSKAAVSTMKELQSWSKVLGTPSVNLWRNFLSVVTNTRLRYFSRIPWRHAPAPPIQCWGNIWATFHQIQHWNGGTILTLIIGDVKIVTLVGQCPNNFVQDCRHGARKELPGRNEGNWQGTEKFPKETSRAKKGQNRENPSWPEKVRWPNKRKGRYFLYLRT